MKQTILTIIAVLLTIFCFALIGIDATKTFGQDQVPLTVETKTADYVVLDPQLYELLAQQDAKLNLALDEIAEIKAMLQGGSEPTPEPTININTASYDELLTVPGIGPVKAGSIIAERGQNGLFSDWADLMRRVSGVGPATVADMQAGGATLE